MSEPCGGRKRKNFESEKYEALMQTASANQLHAVLNVFEENAPSQATAKEKCKCCWKMIAKHELQAAKGKPAARKHTKSVCARMCQKPNLDRFATQSRSYSVSAILR